MKAKFFLSACVVMLSVILVSCGPNDAKIQEEVTQKLTETTLPVTAVVEKGVVTLSGVVETEDQKVQAESTVAIIKGVKSVTNDITVTPPAPVITPDQALTTLVQEALTTAGFTTVAAVVADSAVTLTGEVKKADIEKVLQVVNALNVKQVVNELKEAK